MAEEGHIIEYAIHGFVQEGSFTLCPRQSRTYQTSQQMLKSPENYPWTLASLYSIYRNILVSGRIVYLFE